MLDRVQKILWYWCIRISPVASDRQGRAFSVVAQISAEPSASTAYLIAGGTFKVARLERDQLRLPACIVYLAYKYLASRFYCPQSLIAEGHSKDLH